MSEGPILFDPHGRPVERPPKPLGAGKRLAWVCGLLIAFLAAIAAVATNLKTLKEFFGVRSFAPPLFGDVMVINQGAFAVLGTNGTYGPRKIYGFPSTKNPYFSAKGGSTPVIVFTITNPNADSEMVVSEVLFDVEREPHDNLEIGGLPMVAGGASIIFECTISGHEKQATGILRLKNKDHIKLRPGEADQIKVLLRSEQAGLYSLRPLVKFSVANLTQVVPVSSSLNPIYFFDGPPPLQRNGLKSPPTAK